MYIGERSKLAVLTTPGRREGKDIAHNLHGTR